MVRDPASSPAYRLPARPTSSGRGTALGRAAAWFTTGALVLLAAGGFQCGDQGGTQPPEVPAKTVEGRAVQKISRLLQTTGVRVDIGKLTLEVKPREDLESDLAAQVDLGLRPEQLTALWTLRTVLEATPSIRTLDGVRDGAVDARLPDVRVFYSATRRSMVFIDPESQDADTLDAATASQLVWAFYDQGPGGLTETLYEPNGQLDGIRVRLCLVEGHAHLAQMLVRHATLDNLDDDAVREVEPPPGHLFGTLSDQPCGEGARFLFERYRAGSWGAVIRAVRSPPATSEQMMHPSKVDQDFPVNVALPGWPVDEYEASDPIGKARKTYDDVLGELTMHRLLLERGVEPVEALRAVIGWDGDRVQIYEHESGQQIIMWRSAWDREIDAEQFAAAIAPKGIEPRAFAVQRHGRMVDAVSTNDPKLTARLHALLAERPGEPAAQPADAASTAAIEARLDG